MDPQISKVNGASCEFLDMRMMWEKDERNFRFWNAENVLHLMQ